MPTYLTPGVYVEEVPPLSRPIAGVGTSTAGFIGFIPNNLDVGKAILTEAKDTADQAITAAKPFKDAAATTAAAAKTAQDTAEKDATAAKTAQADADADPNDAAKKKKADDAKTAATASAAAAAAAAAVAIKSAADAANPTAIEKASQEFYQAALAAIRVLVPAPVVGEPTKIQAQRVTLPPANNAKLYTSFVQFTRDYGDLIGDPTADDARNAAQKIVDAAQSTDAQKNAAKNTLATLGPNVLDKTVQATDFAAGTNIGDALTAWRNLVHAVFGFFNNGGTRCYVINTGDVYNDNGLQSVLDKQFAGISEIAIVAAPGPIGSTGKNALVTYCNNMGDRVAVLDPQPLETGASLTPDAIAQGVSSNDYAALYFPNIRVFDPTTPLLQPTLPDGSRNDGGIFIGPSGHVAGVYARVDAARGAYKAPANEPLNGVMSLQYMVSPADQEGLNPAGINALRTINSQILVWGARTLGTSNGEFTYLSTRRYFNFLRKSLLGGTNFLVFEPNTPALWQRITRTVSDFLLGQWRDGGLFGDTPKQAFFVKCDADTNPPDQREQGIVVAMIGIAIVKPAEFVVFRIQQNAGG